MKLIDRIKIKAVFLGFAADTVLSITVGIIWGVVYAIYLINQGVPQAELQVQLTESICTQVFALISGLSCTALGGYIAGKLSKQFEVLHGGLAGFLGLVVFIPFSFESESTFIYNIIGTVGIIPLGMFGGYLAHKKNIMSAKNA